jgi:hypothetical protein
MAIASGMLAGRQRRNGVDADDQAALGADELR